LVVRTIEVPLAPLVRVRWPTARTVPGPSAAASHRAQLDLAGVQARAAGRRLGSAAMQQESGWRGWSDISSA
jgi:hypothetical protein